MLAPPYMRRPTMRLAYCTGIFRWAVSTQTTRPVTTRMKAKRPRAPTMLRCWSWKMSTTKFFAAGKNRSTMPVKIMSEMPLPMPSSVICSPSHMMKSVPVVSVRTVVKMKERPGSRTTASSPGRVILVMSVVRPKDWMIARAA